ncbi:MAG: hypothetical protein ACFFAE_10595 [Candidatus Hodarchaeota archaeon]
MIRNSNFHKYESFFLYETLVGIWVFFALISQFTTDWLLIVQTILFSYVAACLLLKESQRTIIHPLTSIIILCVFRIDQLMMNTVVTKLLTELTTQILVLMLKFGDSILILVLFGSFFVFQSLWRAKMKSIANRLPFLSFVVILALLLVCSSLSFEVVLIDKTIIQIENITRISIVGSCSGIYGFIIFLSSFFFFVNLTKTNRILTREQVISFGTVGIIGVYLLNLVRILILISLSIHFPTTIWSDVHIYLGGILIIGYLVIFWGIIWSNLPVCSSSSLNSKMK